MTTYTRRVSIWCPDWPVTTARVEAGRGADDPVAVVTANRVVACSQRAREQGVRRGLRRREAQGRCPELVVLGRDEAAEARVFEPVVAALEAIAPGVEITRPGLAAIGVRGPTRYFGGETGVLRALSRGVADIPALQGADVLIGIADGAFAAEQAARRGMVIEPGESSAFLENLPIETLAPAGTSPLVDLLIRLGVRTLGAFAALPARDVLARFGPDGAWAHRQALGTDDHPVSGRRPPVEFTVTLDLEPPVDRVDTVAFSARGVAEQFVTDLAAHGLACTCLELQALSENGEETVRRWRHAGVLGVSDVLDRARWQLEGWLSGTNRPSGGVIRVVLVPIEVVPTGTHQQALWGGQGDEDERAARALARVQTLLGHGSVLAPVLEGGRDPGQRTRLVPWGDEPLPLRSPEQPWPGQLPAPAPSVLLDPPRPAQLLDAARRPVVITERGAMPSPPALFGTGRDLAAVTSWAGPWPVDERWWSPDDARRVVRCQVVDVHGRAYLVTGTMPASGSGEPPRWQVDAVYD
ncbi:protein ImuB [Jatrophihabitans endophyticus]|uniref:Protein ImuB n=1 Tax=Jatrophihabitans endophyticus TaxID=1206085 RepID=A0A1M5TQI4_9ACTN|nr:DNA polymerase Y family protein [Jatrophihabitans endophyticus]SHH53022.1 protein ImuB [Jatrophihabitans endophyticus]